LPSPRALRLVVLVVTLSLAYGIWYSYSVVLVALLKEFGWSRSVLAGAFSLFTVVHGGSSAVVGMLCERFRPLAVVTAGGCALGLSVCAVSFVQAPWQLYLAFGVCTALSVCASGWPAALVQVQRDFQDRLGLALGIVSSGVGVGMLVVAPFTQLLIEAYGWRTAYRVLAAICVLWIVPSSLYLLRLPRDARAEAAARNPKASAARATTLAEAVRGQPFWLLFAAFFFGNVCAQTLHVHQVAYLVDHGVTAMIGSAVVSVVGAASIVGKIGGGWLSDRIEREYVFLGGIAIMLAAVAALTALGAAAGVPAHWAIFGYALLFGLGYSVTASLTPALMADRFGGPQFGRIVGLGLFGAAMGSALGPWTAGVLFDRTGSYVAAFAVAATCGVLAATACWRARGLRRRAAGVRPA
jgi:MFS family permease